MLDETTLERRLVTLEQAVSNLQRKLDSKPTPENWLQKLTGSISDEEASLKASEYGRTFRQADKPTENDQQS
jgi:hypothetical protein